MAKNKDAKSFNRTGLFDIENMTLLYEDKNGKYLFDLAAKLEEYNGEEISITVSTDTNPTHAKPVIE